MLKRLLIVSLFVPSIALSVERVSFYEGDVKTTIDRQCIGGMMYTVARSQNPSKRVSAASGAVAISIVQTKDWQGNLIRCKGNKPFKN